MFKLDNVIANHLKNMANYKPIEPIEVLAEKFNIDPSLIIKLDGNENPFGPSEKVQAALASSNNLNIYPDPLQRRLRKAISSYSGADMSQVVAVSGCDELIDLILRLFLSPGDHVIDCKPTFGMYEFSTQVCGGTLVSVERNSDFSIDVSGIKNALTPETKIVFLCSPNNPTGNITPEDDIIQILDTGIIVVVDETYHEFCGATSAHLLSKYKNLIIMRSFSKWAGLAGFRIGYGMMSEALAEKILSIKLPYNITVPSEIAVAETLQDTDLLLQRVRALVAERENLRNLLSEIDGIKVWPSKGNFLLCQFERSATSVHSGLMQLGIFVRSFSGNRLKNCLRISAGMPQDTPRVASAIKKLIDKG